MQRTWIEISKTALIHNITALSTLISPSQLGVVIKAHAYGHGLLEVGQIASACPQVSFLCVAGIDEALLLRAAGITKPILTLAYSSGSFTQAIMHDIALTVYNYETVEQLRIAAQACGKKARIHIKVDTGMSRLGITPETLIEFIKKIQDPHIIIEGALTHISDKDIHDQSFTNQQLDQFDAVLKQLAQEQIIIPITHAFSSGALELAPERHYSMARVGTNIYGLWSSAISQYRITQKNPDFILKPVLTWKTRIIQIKTIPAGSFVGYARTFQTTKETRIAVLPIGYWDGYPRGLANKSVVIINGKPAPVLGIISMNLTTVDITDIPEAQVGDQVTLIGDHPHASATHCAKLLGTLNIELTTRINPTITRIIVD